MQSLFERMADEYDGEVVLEKWLPNGAARLRFRGRDGDCVVKVQSFPNESGILLVEVSPVPRRGAPHIYVSPVPSAVIAVATR